jgi:hypothetical protein
MRALARSYLAVSVVGAALAVRRDRPARLFGLRYPGTVVQQAFTIGTAASPPPCMLALLWWADRRENASLLRLLAAGYLVGVFGEPDTTRALRRAAADPLGAAVAVLQIALPAALLWGAGPPRGA